MWLTVAIALNMLSLASEYWSRGVVAESREGYRRTQNTGPIAHPMEAITWKSSLGVSF